MYPASSVHSALGAASSNFEGGKRCDIAQLQGKFSWSSGVSRRIKRAAPRIMCNDPAPTRGMILVS